ncbi:MAG: branched-chain amino acid transaminase [Pseudonocardia sp.]
MSFADRDGWIWLDGELVEWRRACTHVLNHGLHYASSVFEGARAYGGAVFRLSDHSQRLRTSAAHLGFEVPFSVAELDDACRLVVAANGVLDGYLRPVAWRGSDTMSIGIAHCRAHVAVATWSWPSVFAAGTGSRGIALQTSKWVRPAPEMAPTRAKASALYQLSVLARQAAEAAGFDDALLLDHHGNLADATGANLFLVRDGVLHTPRGHSILNGITRQTIMELAVGRGVEVVERDLRPADLQRADEVFLTGTAYEVQPVHAVDRQAFAIGPVSRMLADDYGDLVRSGAAIAAGATT